METEIIGKETLLNAARFLVEGGHVAVPTETVYGLACNGLNRRAVQNLYEIKGRPAVRPISLMVSGPQAMDQYCRSVPDKRCIPVQPLPYPHARDPTAAAKLHHQNLHWSMWQTIPR